MRVMIITNDDYCILKTVKFHLISQSQQEYEKLSLLKNKSQNKKNAKKQNSSVLSDECYTIDKANTSHSNFNSQNRQSLRASPYSSRFFFCCFLFSVDVDFLYQLQLNVKAIANSQHIEASVMIWKMQFIVLLAFVTHQHHNFRFAFAMQFLCQSAKNDLFYKHFVSLNKPKRS